LFLQRTISDELNIGWAERAVSDTTVGEIWAYRLLTALSRLKARYSESRSSRWIAAAHSGGSPKLRNRFRNSE
jgi:hypothetical protein